MKIRLPFKRHDQEDGNGSNSGSRGRVIGSVLVLLVGFVLILGIYWSFEPKLIAIQELPSLEAPADVKGYYTTQMLIEVVETILYKRGGFLRNDRTPPGLYLDDIPSWEHGALMQVRDLSQTLRNDFSRARSQSVIHPALQKAYNHFSYDSESWIFPSSESEYKNGLEFIRKYQKDLIEGKAEFAPRADNLRDYLDLVQKQLGSISQKLAANVGDVRVYVALVADASIENTDGAPTEGNAVLQEQVERVRTPWRKIDNVFFEARGSTWALANILRAVEKDFADVLQDKNATSNMRQIIRELEGARRTFWSPVVLNGNGFGIFANHSAFLGSYVARANVGLIELRNILDRG